MRIYRCGFLTPSRQTNIRGFGFGSVLVTALLVYLFQLVPVIFTYLHADCPCDVTTFLDLTSLRLLSGSGRVTGQKYPDPVPFLDCTQHQHMKVHLVPQKVYINVTSREYNKKKMSAP